MSHRRYQILTATGAAVLGLVCATLALDSKWWEAGMLAFVAVFLVEASAREARSHRDALACERMALEGEHTDPLVVPCCQFWTATADEVHAPTCHNWSTR